MPNERRLLKSKEELVDMRENSNDIYKTEIIEKYTDQIATGRFYVLQSLCFAGFGASHYKKLLMLKMSSSKLVHQNLLIVMIMG